MLRCNKCHRLGLFRSINPNTGVCLDCERNEMHFAVVHPATNQEETAVIHIPRYFIGNGMRYIKTVLNLFISMYLPISIFLKSNCVMILLFHLSVRTLMSQ